jgi:hypothetical protein
VVNWWDRPRSIRSLCNYVILSIRSMLTYLSGQKSVSDHSMKFCSCSRSALCGSRCNKVVDCGLVPWHSVLSIKWLVVGLIQHHQQQHFRPSRQLARLLKTLCQHCVRKRDGYGRLSLLPSLVPTIMRRSECFVCGLVWIKKPCTKTVCVHTCRLAKVPGRINLYFGHAHT